MNTLGKRISTLRKAKGMTQEQLAERMNVSPQAVSKWENDASCPDISALPLLSGILGVTVDELLGIKEIEPRVVVVDAGPGRDRGKKEESESWKEGAKGGLYMALALIVVGAVFLFSRTGLLPFSGITLWGMVWPALLLGIGVSWLINHRSPLGGGVALLGLYYLLYNLGAVKFELSWGVIWPVILILLGITMLLDRFMPNRWGWTKHSVADHTARSDFSESDGFVRMDSDFCEDYRAFSGAVFAGGDVDVSFGKTTLDLSKAQSFQNGAVLRVDVSFGTMELVLPRTVRAEQMPDKAFGAVQVVGAPDENVDVVIRIQGDVSFGSMSIRYQ